MDGTADRPGKPPAEVVKRDGRVEPYRRAKIVAAVEKALDATGTADGEVAARVAAEVEARLAAREGERRPTVEEIQDEVERALMGLGLPDVAKAYILYRSRRAAIREGKGILGVTDDLKLSLNAVTILERRYLRKDDRGAVAETPGEMFRRVARAVAAADERWRGKRGASETAERFEDALRRLLFLPNSPTLMNAGTPLGQLAACFVLPVPDSMAGIFDAVRNMALIHQSGGGTGFSFTRLRPRNDIVRSTGGVASGPVSFMRIFDASTDVIVQGGRRRGANMGILRVDHPDVAEFATAKADGSFQNFNLSVAVTDAFMEASERGGEQILVNPRTGEAAGRMPARDLLDLFATMAWRTGDPGLVFLDEVNRRHPVPGEIEATNPCGEIPLLPYEACNLGSLNLARMVRGTDVDWDALRDTTRLAVHFLDDVIEASRYPIDEIAAAVGRTRKIGLGVMGFAEMLVRLGISYADDAALTKGREVMAFIAHEARAASADLARERGPFPLFPESRWARDGAPALRNATLLTVAPTGTISLIAGTTSGIEPLYGVAHIRTALEGQDLLEVNPAFLDAIEARGLTGKGIIRQALRTGSVQGIADLPADLKRLFVSAHDLEPGWHVRMQAAFQAEVDNAVSKTVNLPAAASITDVREVYRLAWHLGCKGITVFRAGSKAAQVLRQDPAASLVLPDETPPEDPARAAHLVRCGSEFSGDCRRC